MSHFANTTVGAPGNAAALFDRCEPLRIRYEPGELICQAGSYAAGVHLITSGIALETYRTGPDDLAPRVTDLLGIGDLLGTELFLSGNTLHATSCRAVASVSLLFLERSEFDAALKTHASLPRCILSHLAERNQRLLRALWRSALPAEDRFRALFREFVRLGVAESEPGAVHLPKEVDLRLLASLGNVALRRARQISATLEGVEWTDQGLRLAPDRLADLEIAGR